MDIGTVLRLRNFRHYFNPNAKEWVEYKSPKDEVFVVLILGFEKIDCSNILDCEAVLNKMGWEKKK